MNAFSGEWLKPLKIIEASNLQHFFNANKLLISSIQRATFNAAGIQYEILNHYSMYVFSFEKLESWQLARKLALNIYKLTEKFPDSEKFQMTRQLRRAATSGSSNLAEGSARMSPKYQAHFSVMSYSSLMEVLNHLILSMDLEFITNEKLQELRERIVPLSIKINNLKKAQLDKIASR